MTTKIELTFTQCKQISSNGDLRGFVEQVNDQPNFMSDTNYGMGIDSISGLKSIIQSGCASGAHNSVFHRDASICMGVYGDDVLEYIEDVIGELSLQEQGESWSNMASNYLKTAVELWCSQFDYILDSVEWD